MLLVKLILVRILLSCVKFKSISGFRIEMKNGTFYFEDGSSEVPIDPESGSRLVFLRESHNEKQHTGSSAAFDKSTEKIAFNFDKNSDKIEKLNSDKEYNFRKNSYNSVGGSEAILNRKEEPQISFSGNKNEDQLVNFGCEPDSKINRPSMNTMKEILSKEQRNIMNTQPNSDYFKPVLKGSKMSNSESNTNEEAQNVILQLQDLAAVVLLPLLQKYCLNQTSEHNRQKKRELNSEVTNGQSIIQDLSPLFNRLEKSKSASSMFQNIFNNLSQSPTSANTDDKMLRSLTALRNVNNANINLGNLNSLMTVFQHLLKPQNIASKSVSGEDAPDSSYYNFQGGEYSSEPKGKQAKYPQEDSIRNENQLRRSIIDEELLKNSGIKRISDLRNIQNQQVRTLNENFNSLQFPDRKKRSLSVPNNPEWLQLEKSDKSQTRADIIR